ncbi:MAG: D-alanyl-D-alanine carboxypeptidase family protein [Acidimicrobiia bacterium]
MPRVFRSGISVLALVALLPPPGGFPPSSPSPDLPELTAETWVVYDARSGVVLAEQDADEERPMASVTKVMTALVVRANAELDERTRISDRAAAVGESEIGLAPGERWDIEALLEAMLIRSGNDAAVALAEHVGGSVAGFADLMNAQAEAMGLEHSRFVNPHGLDAQGHFSSAMDLVRIAEAALEDPVLARIVRTRLIKFKPDPGGRERKARNTNRLLGLYPGVVGMKTGFTGQAGRVLISVLEDGDRTLIAVVMGSEDHFADSRELLDFGAHTLTLGDRLLSHLVPEEGGGGFVSLLPTDRYERARVQSVVPLSDGQWAKTELTGTNLGRDIEAWLRDLSPVIAGGRS